MKNENQTIDQNEKPKKVKGPKKGKESQNQTDSVNLEKVKINLKKGNNALLTKTESDSHKNLYLGMEGLNAEEKKKKRGAIRRERDRFINQILGKDRTDSEREDSIQKFLAFYKSNWRVTDFKIETFCQTKNETELSDCKALLEYVKETLE